MAQQNIIIGEADAKQGDTYFDAFTKVEANFTDLYESRPQNIVVVNKLSDFPAPSGDAIFLVANTTYYIGANIETEYRFVMANGVRITSNNPFGPMIIYTGSGVMFSGSDVTVAFSNTFLMSNTASQFFSFESTGIDGDTFGLEVMTIVGAAKFGTFTNLRSVNITNIACFDLADGLTIAGTTNWEAFTIFRLNFNTEEESFTGIDLGTSIQTTTEINNLVVIAGAGSIGITGLANNGNIAPNFIATVQSCEFGPLVTPLTNITVDDIRFIFANNSNIRNSTVNANPYLNVSTIVPIAGAGTYVKINQGNWLSSNNSRLSVSSDGDITNLLEIPIKLQVVGSVTISKVGGGSDLITAELVYNDNPSNSESQITEIGSDNNTPTNIGLNGIFDLQPNDTVSIWVANQDSTANVVVSYAKFTALRVI